VPDTAEPPAQQFVIAAAPDVLKQVVSELEAAPDSAVLRVSGNPTAPERATVTMPQQQVERIRQQYGGAVAIEPDAPLTPYA
jgi:hypothetical protein